MNIILKKRENVKIIWVHIIFYYMSIYYLKMLLLDDFKVCIKNNENLSSNSWYNNIISTIII